MNAPDRQPGVDPGLRPELPPDEAAAAIAALDQLDPDVAELAPEPGVGVLLPEPPPAPFPGYTEPAAPRPASAPPPPAGRGGAAARHARPGRPGMSPKTWSELQKWASLSSDFGGALGVLFDQLKAEGYSPAIIVGWRDGATQAALVKMGRSKVSFSFHNVTARVDGAVVPAALAADVVDRRFGWGTRVVGGREVIDTERLKSAAAFFVALRDKALAAGMHSGGAASSGFSLRGPPWEPYGLAWDPAHVQFLPNSQLGRMRDHTASLGPVDLSRVAAAR